METTTAWNILNFIGQTVTIKAASPMIENGEYILEGADDLGLFVTSKSGRTGTIYVARALVVLQLPAGVATSRHRVA